jgi:hypothetical protein
MTDTIDYQESNLEKKNKVPTFLIILLVLTSLNILYNLINAVGSIGAQDEMEQIESEIYKSLEESGTDLSELPPQILNAFQDFFPRFVDNLEIYGWYQIIFYLLLVIPVVLMFKLKKSGFYLYSLLQVIGALEFLLFFGVNWVTISVSLALSIGAAIWILLYWLNVKHMN